MGNLRSVAKALEAAGAAVAVTSDAEQIAGAGALCVPGQGIFGRCVDNLAARGLTDMVRGWISADRPYLGICLGMQILFDASEEAGTTQGLGILPGRVTKLPSTVPVPHIGWNTVNDTYFYFDHSYGVHPDDDDIVAGWCEHGERFAARVEAGSILGVQFHPEKSGSSGIELLKGWLRWI
jgi:glutamine amidotransferase